MKYNTRLLALFVLFTLLYQGCFIASYEPPSLPYEGSGTWLVNAEQALSLLKEGAILLDARAEDDWKREHVQRAQWVTWQQFSRPDAPDNGKLLADDKLLTEKIQALGIKSSTPVLVVGDPIGGWGEDGRISWMLRTLGHTKAYWVDGGSDAMKAAGANMTTDIFSPSRGDFVVKRVATWDIQKEEIKSLLTQNAFLGGKISLIDTREQREFEGSTPYGESRGGHVPGAIQLHYKELLAANGQLLQKETLLDLLKTKGLEPDKPVIAYCTGGIRSGWFVTVLLDLGFKKVQNYAGSMWEWAAASEKEYPLVSTP